MNAEAHKKPFSVEAVRADFPILATQVKANPLVYLDSAATAQKPHVVIDATSHFYAHENANVRRGVHHLGELATQSFENARKAVARFINAASENEIIFTRQTTEAINLVAQTWGRMNLGPGDEILLSTLEHHANIVPWQLLAAEKGFKINIIPITDDGELIIEEYERLLTEKTKLVAVTHASNALGTINPIAEMVKTAHAVGAVVLVDGAQSIVHLPIDVQALDCDFFVFSGHKLYGPTGIGVLYGKASLLNKMPPYQGGGDMIERVSFEKTTFRGPPARFEAGTPNIAGVIGLAAAIAYVQQFNASDLLAYEQELHQYALERLGEIKEISFVGKPKDSVSLVSFVVKDVHPHDIGTLLNEEGIAVRVGHHCTQPLMQRLGLNSTVRASFAIYNTKAEIDILAKAIHKVISFFK